jgi:hypothetical protein
MNTSSNQENAKLPEHQCIGHQEGDWIIFHCPVCRQYERRVNRVTKEVRVRKGNIEAVHVGSHQRVSTNPGLFSFN